jgi:hypothetical protein
MYDHVHSALVVCGTSDGTGFYSVPVAAGLTVYGRVEFGENHTFSRVSGGDTRSPTGSVNGLSQLGDALAYDFYTLSFDDTSNLQPINWQDTSTREAVLQVAGGRCNRTLGTSTVRFTYPTCASSYVKEVVMAGYEERVEMPAHKFDVSLESVRGRQTNIGDTVTDYLTAVGEQRLELDLIVQEATARWEYHPEPEIEVIVDAAPKSECPGAVFLPREVQTSLIVRVSEPFWDGEPICTWVEGSVHLVNQVCCRRRVHVCVIVCACVCV